MIENLRIYALKATALLGVFSFLYPVVVTARFLIFKNDGGPGCILFALILIGAGLSFASTAVREKSAFFSRLAANPVIEFIFDRHATAYFLSSFAVHIAAVVPMVIAVIIFSNPGLSGLIRATFEALAALLFYLVGVRAHYLDFETILYRQKILIGIILLAASTAISFFTDAYLNFIAYAYILIVTSMIVVNQGKIDQVFLHMNRHLAGVSKDIRKFNIVSVFMLFGIMLIFLKLKDIVTFCLNVLSNIIRAGVILFARIINALFGSMAETESGPEKIQPSIPPELQNEGTSNPYMDLLFKIVFVAIILFAGYKLLPVIFRTIRNIMCKLWRYILSIFGSTDMKVPEAEDYNDEVEEIRPDKASGKRMKHTGRRLKRNIRGLKRITNPSEKIRYLYGMILDLFTAADISIAKSDTPNNVCCKAETENIYIKDITDAYQKVRYGDIIPDADETSKAEKCCTEVTQHIITRLKDASHLYR